MHTGRRDGYRQGWNGRRCLTGEPRYRILERSISRRTAELEHDHMVRLYRADDGTLLTYEELYDEVDATPGAIATPSAPNAQFRIN